MILYVFDLIGLFVRGWCFKIRFKGIVSRDLEVCFWWEDTKFCYFWQNIAIFCQYFIFVVYLNRPSMFIILKLSEISPYFAKRSEILAKYCMVYTIVRQNFGSFSEICKILLNFNIINIVALFIYTTKTKF
jgi:hypothetical protein